jgi:hypothetical protein
VDWDSDGDPDLITGERYGYLDVFLRRDTTLTGVWQYRLLDSTVLDVGFNSQPAVVDWNGDGLKDLLIGEEGGSIRFYPNVTSDTWPGFQEYTDVKADNEPIHVFRPTPSVFDLDRDGLLDLICGADDGLVRYFRNTGTAQQPSLVRQETLRAVDGAPVTPSLPQCLTSRCGFCYWNADSIPDLLISGNGGLVELFLGTDFVGISEEPSTAFIPSSSRRAAPCLLFTSDGRMLLTRPLDPSIPGTHRLRPGIYFLRGPSGTRKVVVSR